MSSREEPMTGLADPEARPRVKRVTKRCEHNKRIADCGSAAPIAFACMDASARCAETAPPASSASMADDTTNAACAGLPLSANTIGKRRDASTVGRRGVSTGDKFHSAVTA